MAKKKKFFPVSSDLIRSSINESFERLVINIMEIDQTIYIWNDLLERAQPFISGRIVFKFIKHEDWFVDGKSNYEYHPIAGKMVKFVSGRWRFVMLDKVDKFDKLSDLRVGKTLPSDALVKKLIDGIEDMLNHRKIIIDQFRSLRMLATGFSIGISKKAEEMTNNVIKLNSKIKIDWKENTKEAIEKLRVENHLRYEKRKERLKRKFNDSKRQADVT